MEFWVPEEGWNVQEKKSSVLLQDRVLGVGQRMVLDKAGPASSGQIMEDLVT